MGLISKRIPEFDGLRGAAALVVVISHIMTGFVPALYFGSEGRIVPTWQDFFAMSPFFVMISGSFAVYIFFVLSGFVIAASADASRTNSIVGNCFARVIRLALPCAASVLLVGALSKFHFFYSQEAASIVDHWWLKAYRDDHDLLEILKEFIGQYFLTGNSGLNGVLWTMQRELLGSIAIYIVFGMTRERIFRLCMCVFAIAVLVILRLEICYYICFIVGSMLFLFKKEIHGLPSWGGSIALVFGLTLGGRPFLAPEHDTIYYEFFLTLGKYYLFVWPIGASLVVLGTFDLFSAKRVVGGSVGRFLGRISFSVYLVHFPFLHSLMAYLFITYGYRGPLEFTLSVICYIGFVIVFAFAFTLLVDEPATRFAGVVRALFRVPSVEGETIQVQTAAR